MRALDVALAVTAALAASALAAPPEAAAPFVLVLGTAQDGGIPHLGGRAAPDEAARREPTRARMPASLLVVDPAAGRRFLIDASPDLTRQLERAEALLGPHRSSAHRAPVDGVLLTHAHIGHYLGLAQFGREVAGANRLPVFGSQRMLEFLTHHGPWELMVRLGHLELSRLSPDQSVTLTPSLRLTPFLVPHRDEYTDTFGFEIRGPGRALLYIPDIDKWERWGAEQGGPIEARLAAVDVALLDATFFDEGELPGRSLAEIPHPLVIESLARFAPLPEAERRKILFTHLNHTNRAALPDSAERRAILAAGMRVADEFERIELGSTQAGAASGETPTSDSKRSPR